MGSTLMQLCASLGAMEAELRQAGTSEAAVRRLRGAVDGALEQAPSPPEARPSGLLGGQLLRLALQQVTARPHALCRRGRWSAHSSGRRTPLPRTRPATEQCMWAGSRTCRCALQRLPCIPGLVP